MSWTMKLSTFLLCLFGTCVVGCVGQLSNRESLEVDVDRTATPVPPGETQQIPDYIREVFGNVPAEVNPMNPENNNPYNFGIGLPGVPGKNGVPGRNGRNGKRGEVGPQGSSGPAGLKGDQGDMGALGFTGAPGPEGQKGDRGHMGFPGSPGIEGLPGVPGLPGQDGQRLWKQCAWTEESDADYGVIQGCSFSKAHVDTWLKVSFTGNLRVGGCSNCCRRWFISFNGTECSSPVAIDAAMYVVGPNTANPLRPRHIEGYCGGIAMGQVSVTLNVGDCPGFAVADAFSGFGSASRIIIEEVQPPQE